MNRRIINARTLIHEILAPPHIELWRSIQSAAVYIDHIFIIRLVLVQIQIEYYRPRRLGLMRLSVYGVGSCATHLVPHGCMHPRQGSSSPFRGPKMTHCELVLDIRASSAKWCDLVNRFLSLIGGYSNWTPSTTGKLHFYILPTKFATGNGKQINPGKHIIQIRTFTL